MEMALCEIRHLISLKLKGIGNGAVKCSKGHL